MSAYQIESNVPIPVGAGRSGRAFAYPWDSLEVGDSFLVPGKKITTVSRAACAASSHQAKVEVRLQDRDRGRRPGRQGLEGLMRTAFWSAVTASVLSWGLLIAIGYAVLAMAS